MTQRLSRRFLAITSLLLVSSVLATAPSYAQSGTSQSVTWNCTGSPCPWGATDSGQALVWPQAGAMSSRLGYTTSSAVYLPSSSANGAVIEVLSGTASAYAGQPGAGSHYQLTTISAGGSYQVSGLPAGEVLSVQSGSSFTYRITAAPPTVSGPPVPESQLVTWTCTSSPCPSGPTDSGHALVWPQDAGAISARQGYTTSSAIYLPSSASSGAVIEILSGTVGAYAGQPSASSHRELATISAGGTYQVSALAAGEVLSVQSGSYFTYRITLPPPTVPGPPAPESQLVTWTCTSWPCPWGPTDSGHALVWPQDAGATSTRQGYTTSSAIYLPTSASNGAVIEILSGNVGAYAGQPGASSHRQLATISAGGTYQVSGLAAGEVLSVQSGSFFMYRITLPEEPIEPAPTEPVSQLIDWTCTSSPCPWGSSASGHALVWPAASGPGNSRLGYTTSAGIYLPASYANGTAITINDGVASVYAGTPGASSHHLLATLNPGQAYQVSGLTTGQVISVQSEAEFKYQIALPAQPSTPPVNDVFESVGAYWRCNTPGCVEPEWVAQVIDWPSWAAYSNNNRAGSNSRTVYSANGEVLHPYMGAWAHGCEVTAVTGTVLIIEWQRGTDVWRETFLEPGESHTISLTSPENGAMLETYDYGPDFSVKLKNCTPQPLP